jgi:uncharacterized protein (TIGR03000 family)
MRPLSSLFCYDSQRIVVVLEDPALAAGARQVQHQEDRIMWKKCLVGAGLVALVTVTLLVSSGTSEAGPFGRRGYRVRSDYYYPDNTMVVNGEGTYYQPYYPDEGRRRVGLLRRNRAVYYNNSMSYGATPVAYLPADGSTVTYSTSGFTDTSYYQPSYPDRGRGRFGLLRRNRTVSYNNSMSYGSTPFVYIPADGSTVTYSTSGYRPGNVTNPAGSAELPARLRVAIPAEKADIWIEGEKSEQSKRVQDYVSPPLTSGKQYYYEVRARWTDAAGKQVERKKSFPIVPGQPVFLDFTRGGPSDKEAIAAPKDDNSK